MSASYRPQFQSFWARLGFNVALGVWCLLPFFVLACLWPQAHWPLSLERIRGLAFVWILAFLSLSWGLLIVIVRPPAADQRMSMLQCQLGLVCSLTIGVPSIALGVFPVIQEQLGSLRDLYSQGIRLDSAENRTATDPNQLPNWADASCVANGKLPVRYLFLVDVSSSFLKPGDQVSNAIAQVVQDLDAEQGVLRSWSSSDPTPVWFIADKWHRSVEGDDGSGVLGRTTLYGLRDGSLRAFPYRELSLNPGYSDLLAPLSEITKTLAADKSQGSCVRVVLFSDLVHSVPARPSLSAEKIRVKADALASQMEGLKNFSVVVFSTLPGPERPRGDVINVDLREFFKNRLAESLKWKEIPLLEYGKKSLEERCFSMDGLYRHRAQFYPLRLTYSKASTTSTKRLTIYFPQAASADERALIQLVQPQSNGNVKLQLYRGKVDMGLLNSTQRIARLPLDSTVSILELAADAKSLATLDGDQAQLVVSFPQRSSLYTIPIRVELAPDEDLFALFRDILLGLNFLPVILAFFMVSFKDEERVQIRIKRWVKRASIWKRRAPYAPSEPGPAA